MKVSSNVKFDKLNQQRKNQSVEKVHLLLNVFFNTRPAADFEFQQDDRAALRPHEESPIAENTISSVSSFEFAR